MEETNVKDEEGHVNIERNGVLRSLTELFTGSTDLQQGFGPKAKGRGMNVQTYVLSKNTFKSRNW